MRKPVVILALSALLFGSIIVIPVGASEHDNGAIVLHPEDNTGCLHFGVGEDGELDFDEEVFTEDVLKVENKNQLLLKCWFDDVPNLSGKAAVFDGLGCLIRLPSDLNETVLTYDTHYTVSKSGNATWTCRADLTD